jgi:hypothetical protein
MNKLTNFIRIIALLFSKKVKISFEVPQVNKLLLIDNVAENYLRPAILKNFIYTSLSTRPGLINGIFYLNIKIIFFFILGLSKKLNLKNSYIFACIKCIKPKVALENTFDHNIAFLANLFPKVHFIVLTQGMWFNIYKKSLKLIKSSFPLELSALDVKNLSNLNILLWGQKDIDAFKKIGVNNNNNGIKLLKTGSWQGSYYKKIYSSNSIIKTDFLFISQLSNHFLNSKDQFHKVILENTVIALNLIKKYISENDLSITYLCRSKKGFDNEEVNLVKNLFFKSKKLIVIRHDSINRLWKEIFRSKVILSIDSTGAHDAMVLKKKVILMPLKNKYIYKHFAFNSKYKSDKDFWRWTVKNNNFCQFKKIADEILKIKTNKYKKRIKDKINYICDPKLRSKSHIFIKSLISSKLLKN